MSTHLAKRVRPAALRVGQRVTVRIGARTVRGVLVEDRGAIGKGGRHLWRVRQSADAAAQEPEREFEMPADRLTAT